MLTSQTQSPEIQSEGSQSGAAPHSAFAFIAGSAAQFGSRRVPSEEVDRAFGMPIGKLRERAGIESLAYAAEGETELSLGMRAVQRALSAARHAAEELDWIIAASETHLGYPSLAAQLHARLSARQTCGALDVGGACLGLLNALAVAQSLIVSGQGRAIAVVTADVHSRTLLPGRVAGEFGGLFGDGASAFLLRSGDSQSQVSAYRLHDFLFGCVSQYSEAVTVASALDGALDVHFDGESLSRAAITRIEQVITAIEERSGVSRHDVGAFATHQPNPRLVSLIAKFADVAPETFPPVARTCGNLGPSTCGAALHAAIQNAGPDSQGARKPVFLASLGPGLLYGGSWLSFDS
jgi:3-oxoacyl-[acyl-carrier-protein] synthase III